MSFEIRSITNKEAGFWNSAIAKDDEMFDRDGERDWCGKVQQPKVVFLRDPNCERGAFSVHMPLFVEHKMFSESNVARIK
jgi:hypothetical protein